jgi:RND family efflux transporter MFP subunit
MKKYIYIGVAVVLVVAVVLTLQHNKAQSEAKAARGAETEKAVTVAVMPVKKGTLTEALSLVGTIAANNDVPIVSETSGKVKSVYTKVGQSVGGGSVLFQVDDELKYAAYQSAQVGYEKAKKDYERYEALHKDGGVSDGQLEQFRQSFKSLESQFVTARRQYTDAKIKTPIAGIVTARNVDVGAYVNMGTVVANVVDISRLKVKVSVGEADVFKLGVGDEVEITTDVYPTAILKGKIETISSKGDDAHTYPVEISLPNSKAFPLKAGMFGRVNFLSLGNRETLVIPREALVGSVKNAEVYVADGTTAHLRKITVGRDAGMQLEVLSGLKEGEILVTGGQNNLRDGAQIVAVKK